MPHHLCVMDLLWRKRCPPETSLMFFIMRHCCFGIWPLLYCAFFNPLNLQEWSLLTHIIWECVLYYWKDSCSNYRLYLFQYMHSFRLTARACVYWSLYANMSSLKSQSAPGFKFPYFFKCAIPVIHPWATMTVPVLDFSSAVKNWTKRFLKYLEHDFLFPLFTMTND